MENGNIKRLHETQGNFLLAEELVASQEGLCSMESMNPNI